MLIAEITCYDDPSRCIIMTILLRPIRVPALKILASLGFLALAGSAWAVPTLPSINTGNIHNITNPPYNAISGGVITNTTAIQSAINAAAAGPATNGLSGGTVEIPIGTFLSGALTLKSKVNLQIDTNATLLFLPENKYPSATETPAYPISATSLTDLEISGPGTIDGNGAGWWAANVGSPPYMIYFSKCQRVLIQDVHLQNSPKMHVVFKNSAANVTIQGITINSPGTSPNTDGIDLIGANCLVQNCTINAGDDNIALGSSGASAVSADTIITNCTFGVGHGVSIGSNTAGGVSNLTVIHCSFTGTDYGIRMKSDNTTSGGGGEGGIAQNLKYWDLHMTNIVRGAIVIYSYYQEYGTPTSITPAIASTQAVKTLNIPIWRDIVFSNVTATVVGSTCVAGIIWGRIEVPATNILLQDVNITAPKTFEIYNASGIQFVDSQISVPSSIKNFTLFNADLTLSNSAPVATVVRLDGLTSTNSLTLVNATATMAASDAFGSDPVTVNAGTLYISNNLVMPGTSTVNFTLGSVPSTVASTGNISLDSTLNTTDGAGFAPGTYTLFTYVGSLSGNPALGTTPIGFPYAYSLDTNTLGQVNFIVQGPSSPPPSPATFGTVTRSGTNLIVSGTGGTTNGTYYVLTTTNLTLPIIQWTPISTNLFDGSGNFIFTNPITADPPQLFFLLQSP